MQSNPAFILDIPAVNYHKAPWFFFLSDFRLIYNFNILPRQTQKVPHIMKPENACQYPRPPCILWQR
jgi:hypothetical protein